MKLLSSLKKEVRLRAETLDDLWCLSQIIEPGDIVSGKTERKIKLGSEEQRKVRVVKKHVFMKIKVEKVEFSRYSNVLRVSGTIVEASEDIQKGSYHTFNIEQGTVFKVEKQEWLRFQRDRLKQAASEKVVKVLIVVLDREEAYFALMKRYGYDLLSSFRGDVQKKGVEEKESSFYKDIIKKIEDYVERYEIVKIVIASPAFWKEELMKNLKDDELKQKITLATCSSADESSINEVLKRPELQQVLKEERVAKEQNLVEELLQEISKNGLAAYGLNETENAANASAVKILLITDDFIQKTREEGNYQKVDSVMRIVEKTRGDVVIISSEHDGGKKLNGLGGIAGLLRFKLSY